jgi:hypothetical protein
MRHQLMLQLPNSVSYGLWFYNIVSTWRWSGVGSKHVVYKKCDKSHIKLIVPCVEFVDISLYTIRLLCWRKFNKYIIVYHTTGMRTIKIHKCLHEETNNGLMCTDTLQMFLGIYVHYEPQVPCYLTAKQEDRQVLGRNCGWQLAAFCLVAEPQSSFSIQYLSVISFPCILIMSSVVLLLWGKKSEPQNTFSLIFGEIRNTCRGRG